MKRSTSDAPKFVTEGSALGMGTEQGLAVPGWAHNTTAPAQHRGCSIHVGWGTQPAPNGGDLVGLVQRDPAPVAQRGFLGGTEVQGVSGAVGGHSQSRHIPQRRSGQGGEPHTQGRGVGTCRSQQGP